uniref:Chromo domain-containing protein n=1 Tax=Globodera pallida TaxID=36090 RepID=A0A183CMW5_GLOPA
MSEWRRFVKTEEARQRGEGLTPVLQNWNFPENKGWAPVEEIKSKAFENASFGAEAFAVKIKANRAAWTNCSGPISSWTLRKGPVGLAPKPYNLATRTGYEGIKSGYYCPSKACLPVNCNSKQLVSSCSWQAKLKKTLPIGYSPVKKIKKQNLRKGNRATEAQAKPKSEVPICVPVNGMAKTFAQVVASLQSVVQPHDSKSLWKTPVPDFVVELTATRHPKATTLLQRQKKPNITICWDFFDKFPTIGSLHSLL